MRGFLTHNTTRAKPPPVPGFGPRCVTVLGVLASERPGLFSGDSFSLCVTCARNGSRGNTANSTAKSLPFLAFFHSVLVVLERVNTLIYRRAYTQSERERKKEIRIKRAYLKSVTPSTSNTNPVQTTTAQRVAVVLGSAGV